jgi:hypothetical protein
MQTCNVLWTGAYLVAAVPPHSSMPSFFNPSPTRSPTSSTVQQGPFGGDGTSSRLFSNSQQLTALSEYPAVTFHAFQYSLPVSTFQRYKEWFYFFTGIELHNAASNSTRRPKDTSSDTLQGSPFPAQNYVKSGFEILLCRLLIKWSERYEFYE